jgi:hypothetical protein
MPPRLKNCEDHHTGDRCSCIFGSAFFLTAPLAATGN